MGILQNVLATSVGDSEGTFWIVILMIVLLSCGVGIWSVVKRRTGEKDWQMEEILYPSEIQGQNMEPKKTVYEVISPEGNSVSVSAKDEHLQNNSSPERRQKKTADLEKGLELLELPFLINVVGNIEDGEKQDIEIRKIVFNELVRRGNLSRIEGNVLKIYAKNPKNLFGKSIQCQAIAELAGRTNDKRHAKTT